MSASVIRRSTIPNVSFEQIQLAFQLYIQVELSNRLESWYVISDLFLTGKLSHGELRYFVEEYQYSESRVKLLMQILNSHHTRNKELVSKERFIIGTLVNQYHHNMKAAWEMSNQAYKLAFVEGKRERAVEVNRQAAILQAEVRLIAKILEILGFGEQSNGEVSLHIDRLALYVTNSL